MMDLILQVPEPENNQKPPKITKNSNPPYPNPPPFESPKASAVSLRAERRAKKHGPQCFLTLACKCNGKQVGSSLVRPDNEGTFRVQDIVSPALVWRCVALAARPPVNAAACAELCAIAKARVRPNGVLRQGGFAKKKKAKPPFLFRRTVTRRQKPSSGF